MSANVRAALNELAEAAPGWLLGIVSPDWFDRYVHRFELQRFPKGQEAQETLLVNLPPLRKRDPCFIGTLEKLQQRLLR